LKKKLAQQEKAVQTHQQKAKVGVQHRKVCTLPPGLHLRPSKRKVPRQISPCSLHSFISRLVLLHPLPGWGGLQARSSELLDLWRKVLILRDLLSPGIYALGYSMHSIYATPTDWLIGVLMAGVRAPFSQASIISLAIFVPARPAIVVDAKECTCSLQCEATNELRSPSSSPSALHNHGGNPHMGSGNLHWEHLLPPNLFAFTREKRDSRKLLVSIRPTIK
ncbi:hypothetical protein L345_07378, partial [Ophiophagus hannah]